MDNMEIREIVVSVDQQERMFDPLLKTLHKLINQAQTPVARSAFALGAPDILVIDGNDSRAQYLAYLLTTAYYRPLIAANSLAAYTHILQNGYVPRAVIIGEDDNNHDRFFLHRLLQQMSMRYEWDIPLIRLVAAPGTSSGPHTQPIQSNPLNTHPGVPNTQPVSPYGPQTQPGHYKRVQLVQENTPSTAPSTGLLPGSGGTRPVSPAQRGVPTPASLPERRPSQPIGRQGVPEGKDPQSIPLEGQSFGRYKVRTRLGANPAGNVYRAYDLLLEQDVALKIIPEEQAAFPVAEGELEPPHLFQQEVDFLAQLDHPHILPVLNCGKGYVSGFPFIHKVMTLCNEGSLADWLARRGGSRLFALEDVVRIVWQVADALQYLHDQQILYQNFKLSNILIHNRSKEAQHLHVMLADFAIVQGNLSTVKMQGTYPYRAPEQWLGQSTPASDQYGLAALTYELLTGRPPFQGTAEHVMKRLHLNMQPQPPSSFNPALSSTIDRILLQALSKNPLDRFASISVFARTLQRYYMQ